ncbi:hypothetical protein PsWM33_01848 [Pseudovibrio sp. WM33]|nr:hypothetical protein PsWM33_01848 [Pseudovibrio sp. WM33]
MPYPSAQSRAYRCHTVDLVVHEGPLSVASARFQTRGALLADAVYSRLLSSRDRFGLGSIASYRTPQQMTLHFWRDRNGLVRADYRYARQRCGLLLQSQSSRAISSAQSHTMHSLPRLLGPSGPQSYAVGLCAPDHQLQSKILGSHFGFAVRT